MPKTSLLLVLCVTWPILAAETRFQQYTEKYKDTPDQARVIASGCLGAAGTQWFSGGGFQPDGTVVAAGVCLGPKLEPGLAVTVLGADHPAPEEFKPKQAEKKGAPEVDKDGKPVWEDLKWTHENATAFIVRFSSDLQQIKSVSRFPWKSGGVTGVLVDSEGFIYLAGPASEPIAGISQDCKELPVQPNAGAEKGACGHVYLAKVSADGSTVLWLRHMKGASNAPGISFNKEGKVLFTGPDLRKFDRNGSQESVTIVPGGLDNRVAVNPVDGTYVRGGEHHWPTGREPYRDPTLNVYKPDGSLLYEFYNWDGPYVGLDNCRLVSDTAIRMVRFDAEGHLLIYAWSDGGNSVMYNQPFDIRTPHNVPGLGMSAWGAGVLSCAYVWKIDTRTYQVIGGTLWLAYLQDKDKPNSIRIDSLGFATDGSLCFAGGAAHSLIQTSNNIGGGESGGAYITVLNKDCSSIRFSSAMPACGKVDIANGEHWGIAQGTVGGRPMALFATGAAEKEDASVPPVANVQRKYGGGYRDAYLTVLDLSPKGGK